MKRILWFAVASAPLLLANLASAGDYHKNGTLYCSQCHVMHFSQSHGYNPDGSGFFTPLGGALPHEALLRDEVNNLCLSCHDNNGFAPDVLGPSNTGNEPGDVRLAGYLNRLGVASSGNAADGHTLDSTATAPGSNPAWSDAEGLKCTDCHHQHGSGGTGHPAGGQQYRNLTSAPGNGTQRWVTYNYETGNPYNNARDVYERAPASYDESNMDWNEPDQTKSAIANWCAGCHSNFHGDVGGTNIGGTPVTGGYAEFVRHPAAGVNIGAITGGHSSLTQYNAHVNKVKVMTGLGTWAPTVGADATPTCITCHKAHGNGNAFGLIFRQGTGTLNENGDTAGNQVEDLCGQCHVQASFFANNP